MEEAAAVTEVGEDFELKILNKKRSIVEANEDEQVEDEISTKKAALQDSDVQEDGVHDLNGDHTSPVLSFYQDVGVPSNLGNDEVVFKFLCPDKIAGPIIGTGGEHIKALNEKNIKVNVAKQENKFPGSNDRVILINGGKTDIIVAIDDLTQRLGEAYIANCNKGYVLAADMYTNYSGLAVKTGVPNPLVVRIAIPSRLGGFIIGRGGEKIKNYNDETGCKILVHDANDPHGTNERVIIFAASDTATLLRGVRKIYFECCSQDGFVFANPRNVYQTQVPTNTNQQMMAGGMMPNMMMPNMMMPNMMMSNMMMPNMMMQMQGMGQNQQFPTQNQQFPTQNQQFPTQSQQHPAPNSNPRTDPMNQYVASSNQNNMYQNAYSVANASNPAAAIASNTSFDLTSYCITGPTYTSDGLGIITMELGIPDKLLGGILGRQGVTVKDTMSISGAKIHVSKKDQYVPGTTNRSLKIVGDGRQIQMAYTMVMEQLEKSQRNVRR